MEVSIDSLLSFDKIIENPASVFESVDKNGKVVLLKNNQPAYIIIKPDFYNELSEKETPKRTGTNTLQDAMKMVLSSVPDHCMHAAALADTIFSRGLYYQKDGKKAQYNQIRARCGHYPNMFEALPGNRIKLKEE